MEQPDFLLLRFGLSSSWLWLGFGIVHPYSQNLHNYFSFQGAETDDVVGSEVNSGMF